MGDLFLKRVWDTDYRCWLSSKSISVVGKIKHESTPNHYTKSGVWGGKRAWYFKEWRKSPLPTMGRITERSQSGAPAWLSRLSFRRQLRSWPHGLWIQVPHPASYCQHGASLGSSVPLSLPLPCLFSLSLSLKNKQKRHTETLVKIYGIHHR